MKARPFFRLFRYRVYRRMLAAFSSIVILLVCLVGTLLYASFSQYATEQTGAYSIDLMSQRVNGTQTLWDEMQALATSMQTDADIISFMTMRQTDQIIRYHAYRQMGNYKALYSFIKNISLVNFQCDQRVTLLYYVDDRELGESLKEINAGSYSFARVLKPSFSNKPEVSVLSIFYPVRYYSSEAIGGIFIDIDQSHLHAMLQGEEMPQLGDSTYIIDDMGNTLFRPDASALHAQTADVFAKVLDSDDRRGSFTARVNEQDSLVTFCRFPNQSWNVITIQPMTHLMKNAYVFLHTVIICLCGVLLVSLLAVFFFSRRVYQPLGVLAETVAPKENRTVDEIEAISSELFSIRSRSNEMEQSLYQSSIQQLLFGLPADPEEFPVSVRQAQAFSVAILYLPDADTPAEILPDLAMAVGKCFAETAVCETVVWANRLVILFCLPGPSFSDAELYHFESLNQLCRAHCHLQIRACVSDIVRLPQQIHDAYGQAQQIAEAAFYVPDEIVLTSRDIVQWESVPHFTADEWSRKIVSCLYSLDDSGMQNHTREFLKLARQQHPLTCRHIIVALLRQCLDAMKANTPPQQLDALLAALDDLAGCTSYQQLEKQAFSFLSSCYQTALLGEQERGALHNQRLAQQVCAFVQRNYTDPNLSLQNAADETALSASYLGRIFKQSTGQSFGEYLTECRLEAARAMLLDSGKTVAAIAEAVGLGNPSYFSTLFKKAYNMSPKVYRETEAARKSGNESLESPAKSESGASCEQRPQ